MALRSFIRPSRLAISADSSSVLRDFCKKPLINDNIVYERTHLTIYILFFSTFFLILNNVVQAQCAHTYTHIPISIHLLNQTKMAHCTHTQAEKERHKIGNCNILPLKRTDRQVLLLFAMLCDIGCLAWCEWQWRSCLCWPSDWCRWLFVGT